MNQELTTLALTAASIGFLHTLLGPDHYLPFVAMAEARTWSRMRTIVITILCGIGHVAGSVVLGLIGVALGFAVGNLESIESTRGNLAAWALIAFGLVYTAWGLRRALKKKIHDHDHVQNKKGNITPWILFTVFVLGPCEPLIPILMYPAAQASISGMILVTLVFAITTIVTMTAVVILLQSGARFIPARGLTRFSHALAGFVILLCGLAIQFGL